MKAGSAAPSGSTEGPRVTLPLDRHSLVWRASNDPRTVLTGPALLLLQVAHPVVAAGVAQHSDYAADPFGRLVRTLAAMERVIYGGQRAGEAAAQLRAFHRGIAGRTAAGARYTAFDPEAWAWVHATLGWGMHEAARRFGVPFTARESDQLWGEWRAVGELYRVRSGDLPASWDGVPAYVDAMVADRLQRTEVFESVLSGALQRVRRPGFVPVPPALWNRVTAPLTTPLSILAIGTLPASARAAFGLHWGLAHRQAYRAACTALQAAGPVVTHVPQVPWTRLSRAV